MADAPAPLDYADSRRRSRRRFWMAALVASALACGVVGRLLYARLAPIVAGRLEAVAAQREVDALSPNGVPFKIAIGATSWSALVDAQAEAARHRLSFVANRFLQAHDGGLSGACVSLVRLRDTRGRDRIVSVSLLPGGTAPVDAITLLGTVTGPATLLRTDAAPRVTTLLPLVAYRARFHLDAPAVDPNDPRRLLLTGVADDVPFARELTIGADDRVQLHEIPATRPTSAHE